MNLPEKKKFLFYPFLFWLIFPCLVFSQNPENNYNPGDTVRVNALLKEFTDHYRDRDDSIVHAYGILSKAYDISKQLNYKKGLIKSSYMLGEYFTSRSNPAKAVEFFYKSLEMAELEKEIKDISRAIMGIGILYYTQKDWISAKKYFHQALALDRKCYNKIGISTHQYLIGICESELKNYASAKCYLDSAFKLKLEMKSEQGINECYMAFGNFYKYTRQYDSSLFYFNKSLPYMQKSKDPIPLALINCSYAEINYHLKNYDKALEYGLKAKVLTTPLVFKDLNLNSDEILYKIYMAKGEYKKANGFLINYYSVKDSILNRDVASRIASVQLTYEFDKIKSRQELLQKLKDEQYNAEINTQERKRKAVSAVALLSIILIIVIAFAYRLVNKEKKASESLLLNILPKETADELKKYGKAIPKKHQGVSILFSDIENFTGIAERLSPEDLVETLDFYFNGFDRILTKYGIEKIKTIGDAYMCVAGLKGDKPPSIEAENLVNAALDMVALHQELNTNFINKFNINFNFRIGIHSGSVISGVVGLNKYAYDIWGDAVNTAARMEQNSQSGRVNVSGSTYELVFDKFNFEYRGKIHAKNKGDIDMYFVSRTLVADRVS